MASLNSVIVVGNLTRDPEIKMLPNSGNSVCNLGLALNRKWKDAKGEWKEEVCFVGVEVWGKSAVDCAENLKKGQQVLVTGRLKSSSWEKDGVKHFPTTVNAFCLYKLDFSIFKADEESDDPESTVPEEDPVPF